MPINSESTPPPLIGKIGPYTVFMTPPPTPSPTSQPQPVFESPKKVIQPPPVQPPPHQFDKSVSLAAVPNGNASVSGFFRNAVSKVQNAHSRLDDHLARWFGLNQSKYQWALDDYYESKGMKISINLQSFCCTVPKLNKTFILYLAMGNWGHESKGTVEQSSERVTGSLNLWTIEKLFIPIYAMAEVDLIVYTMPDEVASHLGM
ncbi:uncharacterized protein E6C27_scaffold274G005900 [Cucumis melo var. makuwa]|uniref:Uncharacterized protein n=1 Tax=Cucumis melo var. makuwa TaxID=1194695 RepID=A0A5A7USX1_CUCMM|nr:uncharacterized protein E6C27_scaffold274G005900 [Cucumis melo var. makuwa]